jgi:endonuclease YncB( thermonuclease family)
VSVAPARIVLLLLGIVVGVVGVRMVIDARDDPMRSARTSAQTVLVVEVVDGDTLVIGSGRHVRLIGIDTPERDTCGYQRASDALRSLVEGRKVRLVNPESVQDQDRYGRLLRYVDREGADAGLDLLRVGLAVARYDSRDGYDPHPREESYHRADRAVASIC